MSLTNKVLTMLVLLMILSACNSQRVKFNPDAYKANSELEAIVSERNVEIQCRDEKFNEYACMHRTKWEELRTILQSARIPKELKTQLLKQIDNITGKFEKITE